MAPSPVDDALRLASLSVTFLHRANRNRIFSAIDHGERLRKQVALETNCVSQEWLIWVDEVMRPDIFWIGSDIFLCLIVVYLFAASYW